MQRNPRFNARMHLSHLGWFDSRAPFWFALFPFTLPRLCSCFASFCRVGPFITYYFTPRALMALFSSKPTVIDLYPVARFVRLPFHHAYHFPASLRHRCSSPPDLISFRVATPLVACLYDPSIHLRHPVHQDAGCHNEARTALGLFMTFAPLTLSH